MPRSWDEIRTWRRGRRAALAEARLALPAPRRRELNAAIADTLGRLLLRPPPASLGFYWPFKGEVDLRPLVRALRDEAGTRAALPVVVRERAPVEFWEWDPGARLARGVWGIPIPTERVVLTPGVLLVPLLGFDGRGYRLGYGGGYYDRTLAALRPRPFAIGVGYEVSRIQTIHPQPHDARMDAIVTERGAFAVTDAGLIPFEEAEHMPPKRPEVPPPGGPERGGSPPCFADEADPDYMLARRMDRRELAGLLGALLDAERRLADALTELERMGALPGAASARVRAETAPLRARLSAQAARLGGALGVRPSGPAAVPEADDPAAALRALHRYILREIDRALPLVVEEQEAAALLRDVRAAHARALAETEPGEGRG